MSPVRVLGSVAVSCPGLERGPSMCDSRDVPDDSWKRPPGGFRYRGNSPAGHVERALAAIRGLGVGGIWLVGGVIVFLILLALR